MGIIGTEMKKKKSTLTLTEEIKLIETWLLWGKTILLMYVRTTVIVCLSKLQPQTHFAANIAHFLNERGAIYEQKPKSWRGYWGTQTQYSRKILHYR